MGYGFRVEVWGEYACFSRPELKVERVSYEVITPSAARGIIEAVLWKPAIRYVIDEIAVCAPIRFVNIRRNEVEDKASPGREHIIAPESRVQRATMALRDVRYVISGHFELTDKAGESDNEGKFSEMLHRRLGNGQHFTAPYLGTREFPAYLRPLKDGERGAEPIKETRSLGLMLHDIDYVKSPSGAMEFNPVFFMAEMIDGVIDLRGKELLR
jgi:CRISPR-associated protein Cas5d